jgi:hypothetical protein
MTSGGPRFVSARNGRQRGGCRERLTDQHLSREASGLALAAIDTAGEREIVALFRARLDVAAIDADGGRAEKPEPGCRLGIRDLDHFDRGPDAKLCRDAFDQLEGALVIRAALEVQDLDERLPQLVGPSNRQPAATCLALYLETNRVGS